MKNREIPDLVRNFFDKIRKREYSGELNKLMIDILTNLASDPKYSSQLVYSSLNFATDSTFLKNCVIGLGKCSQSENINKEINSRNVFIDMSCSQDERGKVNNIKEILKFFELNPYFAEDEPESKALMCKICHMIQICKYAIVEKNSYSNSIIFELGLLKGLGIICLTIFDKNRTYYVGTEKLEEKNGKIKIEDLFKLGFTDLAGVEHQEYVSEIDLLNKLGKLIIKEIPERDRLKDQELEKFISKKETEIKRSIPKKTEPKNLFDIKGFESDFKIYKNSENQNTKNMLLDKLEARLSNLPYDGMPEDIKNIILEFLTTIKDELNEKHLTLNYLQIIDRISGARDKYVNIQIKNDFLEKIEREYNEYTILEKIRALWLKQRLNNYNLVLLKSLIIESFKWDEPEFNALKLAINLNELKKDDIIPIREWLWTLYDKAEKEGDKKIMERAKYFLNRSPLNL